MLGSFHVRLVKVSLESFCALCAKFININPLEVLNVFSTKLYENIASRGRIQVVTFLSLFFFLFLSIIKKNWKIQNAQPIFIKLWTNCFEVYKLFFMHVCLE